MELLFLTQLVRNHLKIVREYRWYNWEIRWQKEKDFALLYLQEDILVSVQVQYLLGASSLCACG